MKKKNIVFLTGPCISQEAGIPVIRRDQLWEGYDPGRIASVDGFGEESYEFFNLLHTRYSDIGPTKIHREIAALSEREDLDVRIVTFNVDDLHEKAGSQDVLHLYGNFSEIRAVDDPRWIRPWGPEIIMKADTILEGHQIRPNIVLFGETIRELPKAVRIIGASDILIVLGVPSPLPIFLETAKGKVVYDTIPSLQN